MSYPLDFKKLAETPIMDVAAMLGLSLAEKQTPRGVQFVGTCPLSGLPAPDAFKVTPGVNRWICFCPDCKTLPKNGGDCIELVRRFRKLSSPKDAAAEIARLNGAGKAAGNASPSPEQEGSRKPDGFDPLAYVKTLDPEHEALRDLDILPETFIQFQAGYSAKGLNRGRLAVAWHDLSGAIRLFIGVALDGTIPRYLVPKGHEAPYWFNAHRLEAEGEELRIVSGVPDVLRAVENGAVNVVCPLRPVDALSLAALAVVLKDKQLTAEF